MQSAKQIDCEYICSITQPSTANTFQFGRVFQQYNSQQFSSPATICNLYSITCAASKQSQRHERLKLASPNACLVEQPILSSSERSNTRCLMRNGSEVKSGGGGKMCAASTLLYYSQTKIKQCRAKASATLCSSIYSIVEVVSFGSAQLSNVQIFFNK